MTDGETWTTATGGVFAPLSIEELERATAEARETFGACALGFSVQRVEARLLVPEPGYRGLRVVVEVLEGGEAHRQLLASGFRSVLELVPFWPIVDADRSVRRALQLQRFFLGPDEVVDSLERQLLERGAELVA